MLNMPLNSFSLNEVFMPYSRVVYGLSNFHKLFDSKYSIRICKREIKWCYSLLFYFSGTLELLFVIFVALLMKNLRLLTCCLLVRNVGYSKACD